MRNEISERISPAMIKYLLGKELRERLKKAEEDYIHAVEVEDEEYIKSHKFNSKMQIAECLGKECHLSSTTLFAYESYAKAIEKVKEKNEKLAKQVLAGETNMTYRDLMNVLDVL